MTLNTINNVVYEVYFSNNKHAYEEILYFKVDGCQVARLLNLTHIFDWYAVRED